MKNSFSLLITLILITIFSFFTIFIIQTKSLSVSNLTNSYLQTQTKLHLDFFKQYINSLDLKTKCIDELSFDDDIYKLKANISFELSCQSKVPQNITIDIFANAKTLNNEVNLHERLIKQLN
ncbi:MAG: hypothetical protein ACNI28_10210 [Arcobacter sp.]|uniref:hypothetical protein n=1 Tax=Arcobacter sp. TaxID=1872629 RepID=UPI003B008A40